MNRNNWDFRKAQREKLNNNKTLAFSKVDLFLGLIYKFFPILLIYFVYLDYSVFVNVFNIETGYFYTIFTNDLFSSLGLIFIYILIPIIFILTFFLFGAVSLKISIVLGKIIYKIKIDKIYKKILLSDNSIIKKLFLFICLLAIMLIVICILFIGLIEISNLIKNISFTFAFAVLLGIYIFIKAIWGVFYLYLNKLDIKGIKCNSIFEILTFIIILFVCLLLYFYDKNYIFIFILYYSYHWASNGYYEVHVKKIRNKIKKDKIDYFIQIITLYLFVFVSFIFFDDVNIKSWKEPIVINKGKKAFKDSNFNLIFNRGLLLNNKNSIKIQISKTYLPYIDIDSVDYLSIHVNESNENSITYKIKDDSQYLNLTKNLKMYFQPANDRTIVFLIEEKKFANKNGSEYILIELSDYKIEKSN